MKKIISAVVMSLALAGCSHSSPTTITGNSVQQAEKLSQIISRGGQASCVITNLLDQSQTKIIVSGKKMKFVGTDTVEGRKGSMINDGLYTYIWSEGEKTGIKTKLESGTPQEPQPTTQTDNPGDTSFSAESYEDESKFKMQCNQGGVSEAEFAPPKDVTFTDLSEMMRNLPTVPALPKH